MVRIPEQHSKPQPDLFTLARDYGRYGLQQWQAREVIDSCFWDRSGGRPDFLVFHIQDGTTPGSLEWWSSDKVDASSNIMIQLDGSLLYIVPRQHGPWTNGDVKNPLPEANELLARGGNANNWSNTCELEGVGPVSNPPQAQVDSLIWWAQDEIIRNPRILDAEWCMLAHRHINSVTRGNCGLYLQHVVDGVNAWLEADVVPAPPPEPAPHSPYPPGMSEQLAKRLYGSLQVPWSSKAFTFNLERSECSWWLARGKAMLAEGEDYTRATWPKIEDVIRRGDGKTRTFVWQGGVAWEQVVKGF